MSKNDVDLEQPTSRVSKNNTITAEKNWIPGITAAVWPGSLRHFYTLIYNRARGDTHTTSLWCVSVG